VMLIRSHPVAAGQVSVTDQRKLDYLTSCI